MAILQLSRITHRKGLAENLPQLAGAEFGWILDERRLFIGNGVIEDGAPAIGNTEILTEFSDILALGSSYTYKGLAAGYVSVTGPNGDIIVRSLQSKFDDKASVKDFGAVGDGQVDDTDAINRALFELFCRETNPETRRSLFFPAGRYKVSSTIKIPPHAKLYGEGITSSIIYYVSQDQVLATDIEVGKRYAISTVGSTDFTLIGASANTVDTIFTSTAVGVGTGEAREVHEQVVETADALQQTGSNIGTNGAERPTGIEMDSMAIYSTEDNTLLKLDSVTNSGFHYVGLHGLTRDEFNSDTLGNSTSAIEIASSVSATHDVTLSKLDTQGTTYALRASGNVKGIVLENSGIDFHYQGVHIHNPIVGATEMIVGTRYKIITVNDTVFTDFGAPDNNVGTEFTAGASGAGTGEVINLDIPGPTGIIVSRNIFDNIAFEGVHFHNVLFNSTAFNVFYNVGNNLDAGLTPASHIIHFETDKCVSIGDLFQREVEGPTTKRIALLGNGGIAIDSTHSIHLGSYEREVGIAATLKDATISETVFTFEHAVANTFKIDYNINRDGKSRMGTMVISNADGGNVTYNDEYTETADTGVELTVIGASTNSLLQFTTSASGFDGTIKYSVVRLD